VNFLTRSPLPSLTSRRLPSELLIGNAGSGSALCDATANFPTGRWETTSASGGGNEYATSTIRSTLDPTLNVTVVRRGDGGRGFTERSRAGSRPGVPMTIVTWAGLADERLGGSGGVGRQPSRIARDIWAMVLLERCHARFDSREDATAQPERILRLRE